MQKKNLNLVCGTRFKFVEFKSVEFLTDSTKIFEDHEMGLNNNLFKDHQSTLIKLIAERYFTLQLFTYGKRYNENVVKNGQPGDQHKLTKLIFFQKRIK